MDIDNDKHGMSEESGDGVWPPSVEEDSAAVKPEIIRPSTLTGRKWLDFIIGSLVPPTACLILAAVKMTEGGSNPTLVLAGAFVGILAAAPLFVGLMPWEMHRFATTYRSPTLATGAWIGMVVTVAAVIALKLLGGDASDNCKCGVFVGNTISLML